MPIRSGSRPAGTYATGSKPGEAPSTSPIYQLIQSLSREGFAEKVLPKTVTSNPAFDQRITAVPNVGGHHSRAGVLYRGRITHTKMTTTEVDRSAAGDGTPLKRRRSVDFLYNPTQVAMNYQINSNVLPTDSENSADTSPRYAASGQTLSWTLYFNRMYEVASNQEHPGVLVDVQAMEYLLGTFDGLGIQAEECLVLFGATTNLVPFAFNGYITNFDVTYLQFSRRMVPTVAMVQVGLSRRLHIGDTTSGGTTGGTPSNPGNVAPHRTDGHPGGPSQGPVPHRTDGHPGGPSQGAVGTSGSRTAAPAGVSGQDQWGSWG